MTPAASGPSPAPRIAAFYATLFMTQGAATIFAGIWFQSLGISATRIGLINAAPVLVLLLVNLWIGRIADRADDWRRVIVTGAVVSGLAALFLALATGFWSILVIWTLTNAAYAAVVPVTDAAAMRLSRRIGFDFSAIRAWGTVGYLAVLFATGYLLTWFGPVMFLPIFCAVALLRGLAAFGLPRFRAPADLRPAPVPGRGLFQTIKPWFLLPLVGWSIVFSTHLVLNGFQSLLWKDQGLPENVIGALITLGAACEAAMFFLFRHLGLRVPARWLILASAVVTALRWAAFGFSPAVIWLVPLQMLHGITYAMGFLACVTFITNWTEEDIAAEAQSFFVVLQQGFSVFALIAFGWLAGRYGAQAYFASAAFAGFGGVLIWISLRLRQPAPPPKPAA
jgi:PPP family 3-phenylpropionic acid transporter